MNNVGLVVDYRWMAVERTPGEPYQFPYKTTKFMKDQYSRPAIYRWSIHSPKATRASIYLGETENFFRRIGGYLHPGPSQKTNLRLNMHFHSVFEGGSRVSLDQLYFAPFRMNSVLISPETLRDSFHRRMMEAFLIAASLPTSALRAVCSTEDQSNREAHTMSDQDYF